ncbi:MAG: TlpA family protein disulfide reductase [Phycisphaerales bacterium]
MAARNRHVVFLAAVSASTFGLALLAPAAVEAPGLLDSRTVSGRASIEAVANRRATFPRDWFINGTDDRKWAELQKLQGKRAPTLRTGDWVGPRRDMSGLRGQIIVIDFWATWCGPCKAAIPKTNEIAETYRSRGVEVVGICCTEGSESMASTARAHGMKYPTGADLRSMSSHAHGVTWWPFYVLVDRKGIVRAAGLKPDRVKDAVEALLAEQP